MSDKAQRALRVRDLWEEALDWHTHLKEATKAEQLTTRSLWLLWKSDADNLRIFEQLSNILELGSRARRRPFRLAP